MKRKDALTLMRVAGYHGDTKGFTRLYTENRISMPAANKEYFRGQDMKTKGIPCGCINCKQQGASHGA